MGPRDASTLCRLDAAQSQFQSHKDKYEKLRADVAIKLKFLEENKVGRAAGCQMGLCCARVSLALSVGCAASLPHARGAPADGQCPCSGWEPRGEGQVSARPSACLLPAAGSCFLAGGSSSGPIPYPPVLGRSRPGPFPPSLGAGQWVWEDAH